jgi:hypothetical protein
MTNSVTAINPMAYTWPAERVAVLNEYLRRVAVFRNAEALVKQNRAGAIHASEVYHALESMTKYREFHSITRREMTAFNSRNAVKCSSVTQAIEALTRMFSRSKAA